MMNEYILTIFWRDEAVSFSVVEPLYFAFYQLDLITPGSMPVLANSRKQIRQMENFRI